MNSLGIIRKLDDLGRFVVPMEYRRALGLKSGDEVTITVVDGVVVATPRRGSECPLCGAKHDAA